MTKREFMEQAALRAVSEGQSDRVVKSAALMWDAIDDHFFQSPLGLQPGKEFTGPNLRAICEWADSLPESTRDAFAQFVRDRYGSGRVRS